MYYVNDEQVYYQELHRLNLWEIQHYITLACIISDFILTLSKFELAQILASKVWQFNVNWSHLISLYKL